jgi:cell wall-associated NlpC family hydrolase
VPAPALTAPPIGATADVPVGLQPLDPIGAAATTAYTELSSWRTAQADLVSTVASDRAAADAQLRVAASDYRAARDALAAAVVTRAGRPPGDAVALSAAWEITDVRRVAVVLAALMQVGKRYVFAAAGPDTFDCSGLTLFAWRSVGVGLVHYAVTQRQQSLDARPDSLQPGDLVFRFRRPGGHVMLYLGLSDLVVQAGGASTGVVVGAWGHADAFGSPLASPPPAAERPAALFGVVAGATRVAGDVPFADVFNAVGAHYGVAPSLLAAVAAVGTGFREDNATVDRGGLMLLRPAMAAELGVDVTVPESAIDGAARRLADLWSELHDDGAVVAAYPTALHGVRSPVLVPHDPVSTAFVTATLAYARTHIASDGPPMTVIAPTERRVASRAILPV